MPLFATPGSIWKGNSALVLIATLLSLALGELTVRGLGLAPNVMVIDVSDQASAFRRSDNPILGFELKANYRNDSPNFIVNYRSTNSHGQRDREREVEKPKGVRRILVVGDSVVEGAGIKSLDHTISRSLEKLLAEEGVEVLNFGVSGYCTRSEVELLEVKGLEFEPDTVIIVFVENDFDNFNRQLFQLGSAAPRPAWVKTLYAHSHLFRTTAIALDLFRLGVDADPVGWNSEAVGDNNVAEGLVRLRELADQYGFEAAIAIWPKFTDEEILDVHFMPRGSEELIVERLAKANGIPTFRFSEHFRRDLEAKSGERNPRLRYTTGDGMHPSRHGARIAAAAIQKELANLGPVARARLILLSDDEVLNAARSRGSKRTKLAIIYNNTANELAEQGEHENAIVYYRRALELEPGYEMAHNNLGNVLMTLGRLDEAIENYEVSVASNPRHSIAHYNLAFAISKRGEHDRAISHYREALEFEPDLRQAQTGLGDLLESLGRYDELAAHWSSVIARRPQSKRARQKLSAIEVLRAKAP